MQMDVEADTTGTFCWRRDVTKRNNLLPKCSYIWGRGRGAFKQFSERNARCIRLKRQREYRWCFTVSAWMAGWWKLASLVTEEKVTFQC